MSNSRASTAQWLIVRSAAVLAAAALFAAPLQAQQGNAGEPSQLLQQVQAKQAEIQQLNQELQQIQQSTIEANPGLADKRDQFMSMVDDKMSASGVDPDASRAKMEDLQGQLESGELSEQESQAASEELRKEQASMRQAQGEAMQDPEVQEQIQSLNEELLAAMREQNPDTDNLISELQTAQQEYQTLMQQAMQEHGGADPTQG
jgi:DNA repair exonuclease SbcCD ATPase subunit